MTTYATWPEKIEVTRAAILAISTNTVSDVYSSDAYNIKLLRERFDQTHNTNS